jgi:hypothetical protein
MRRIFKRCRSLSSIHSLGVHRSAAPLYCERSGPSRPLKHPQRHFEPRTDQEDTGAPVLGEQNVFRSEIKAEQQRRLRALEALSRVVNMHLGGHGRCRTLPPPRSAANGASAYSGEVSEQECSRGQPVATRTLPFAAGQAGSPAQQRAVPVLCR